jgi:hypothetical protein
VLTHSLVQGTELVTMQTLMILVHQNFHLLKPECSFKASSEAKDDKTNLWRFGWSQRGVLASKPVHPDGMLLSKRTQSQRSLTIDVQCLVAINIIIPLSRNHFIYQCRPSTSAVVHVMDIA